MNISNSHVLHIIIIIIVLKFNWKVSVVTLSLLNFNHNSIIWCKYSIKLMNTSLRCDLFHKKRNVPKLIENDEFCVNNEESNCVKLMGVLIWSYLDSEFMNEGSVASSFLWMRLIATIFGSNWLHPHLEVGNNQRGLRCYPWKIRPPTKEQFS